MKTETTRTDGILDRLIRDRAWVLEGADMLDCRPSGIVTRAPDGWEPNAYWRAEAEASLEADAAAAAAKAEAEEPARLEAARRVRVQRARMTGRLGMPEPRSVVVAR